MNKHQTTIHARCPFAPVWDYYTVTVETEKMIRCEKIEEVCEVYRGEEESQEEITRKIYDKLRAALPGVVVSTRGNHGSNTRTTVSYG